jgi:hypothetical protein
MIGLDSCRLLLTRLYQSICDSPVPPPHHASRCGAHSGWEVACISSDTADKPGTTREQHQDLLRANNALEKSSAHFYAILPRLSAFQSRRQVIG